MPLGRGGPGLLGTAARSAVFSGVSGRVQHRQQQKWAAEEPQPQAAAPEPAPVATGGEPGYIAELRSLAELRDSGAITAEDFEAKKKQLLGV